MRNGLKAYLQCNNSNDPNVTFGDTVANLPRTENVECHLNAKHVFHFIFNMFNTINTFLFLKQTINELKFQIRELVADDPVLHRDLLATITKCRDDEQDHHDTGLEQVLDFKNDLRFE